MKRGQRIPNELRNRIRADYLLLNMTFEQLSKKYRIHVNTISALAKREDFKELKNLFRSLPYIEALLKTLMGSHYDVDKAYVENSGTDILKKTEKSEEGSNKDCVSTQSCCQVDDISIY